MFNQPVGLRNPASIRPWQHVIEPVGAYLLLAARMTENPIDYCTAYNFGPNPDDMLSVEALTNIFIDSFGVGSYKSEQQANAPHEAKLLLLDSTKAAEHLGWKPQLDARRAIEWTAKWYADKHLSAREKCADQIGAYLN